MVDSQYSAWAKEGRLLDTRVVDKAWREDRLPVVELDVPTYDLPLPEGVGEERPGEGGTNLSMREIEETWRERLHDNLPHQSSRISTH